jgi:cysteine desulfurase
VIYLDNLATTPADPRVMEAARPYFETLFGNPHSAEHEMGHVAARAVEVARAEVASLIGADPREIIFTSGATEANNLAIKGAARFAGRSGPRQIITLATEHKCVLESVRDLASEGFTPVIVPVLTDGSADLEALKAALATPTLLVSVMAANNETGVLQNLPALAELVRAAGALLHSDLAQAAGKIPVDVNAMGLHLASVSGHKLYGPKGIGALYVRRRPRVRLTPLFSGGGQERGLRSGTIPAPLAVGFGAACIIAQADMKADYNRIMSLRHGFMRQLQAACPGVVENAGGASCLPGALSLRFPGVRALDLMAACPGLCVSTGSACTSAEVAPSHVLTAMGLTREEAARSLRIGIGRFTSAGQINEAAGLLAAAHQRLARTHAARADDILAEA